MKETGSADGGMKETCFADDLGCRYNDCSRKDTRALPGDQSMNVASHFAHPVRNREARAEDGL